MVGSTHKHLLAASIAMNTLGSRTVSRRFPGCGSLMTSPWRTGKLSAWRTKMLAIFPARRRLQTRACFRLSTRHRTLFSGFAAAAKAATARFPPRRQRKSPRPRWVPPRRQRKTPRGGFYFIYRYIPCESCSQFDSLPPQIFPVSSNLSEPTLPGATYAPSTAPSSEPTDAPITPSTAPSSEPTNAPITRGPTLAGATDAPTAGPTKIPTVAPTQAPVVPPTELDEICWVGTFGGTTCYLGCERFFSTTPTCKTCGSPKVATACDSTSPCFDKCGSGSLGSHYYCTCLAPTFAPTPPTFSPSSAPTTAFPTMAPSPLSAVPTAAPTLAPAFDPTVAPSSAEPTAAPTALPPGWHVSAAAGKSCSALCGDTGCSPGGTEQITTPIQLQLINEGGISPQLPCTSYGSSYSWEGDQPSYVSDYGAGGVCKAHPSLGNSEPSICTYASSYAKLMCCCGGPENCPVPSTAPTTAPTSAPTNPPAPPGWHVSASAESCSALCGTTGCSVEGTERITTVEQLQLINDVLNPKLPCTSYGSSSSWEGDQPSYVSDWYGAGGVCKAHPSLGNLEPEICTYEDAYSKLMCCCGAPGDCPVASTAPTTAPTSAPTNPPAPPGWHITTTAQSCNALCGTTGCSIEATESVKSTGQLQIVSRRFLFLISSFDDY